MEVGKFKCKRVRWADPNTDLSQMSIAPYSIGRFRVTNQNKTKEEHAY